LSRAVTAIAQRFGAPEAYTPQHLAQKILSSRAALEGERKQVTVLFADLKGSMELLADRDPEEARKILDPVLEHMMEAVHRYEGTVNQVMGDGIMALFGAPLAHEDHAVRACYAALRLQEQVKRYAEDARREHGVHVQIRVGLNSGEVVVRAIGSDLHIDYTAVGQTTHLAARMEQMARPGTILLARDTLVLAEGFVQVTSRGPVPVKGLPEPIEVFELVDAEPTRGRFQAAARGLSRFVGRRTEFETLDAALQRARSGQGQVLAIIGEPGVGKSRLFYEFIDSPRARGCTVFETSAVSYGKLSAYLPFRELLRTYFQIEPHEHATEIHAKVDARLAALDRALPGIAPPLIALLDVPVADGAWAILDPGQRRHRIFDALTRLLLRLSHEQPLILMVENLHWVDAETRAFLYSLVEILPTARLLLLVNYRPEYQHGWGGKPYYVQLRLDPLSADSADELLRLTLGKASELEPLKRLLFERTGGNPFFLEECIRTLIETKQLVGESGAYRLGKSPGAIQIPATVQAILAARIDRLSADRKRALQCAAVIGKDVSFPLLQAVVETPEPELREMLAELQNAEFVYETSLFPELEYAFKHALTQEVAYSTLLLERRRELHVRIVTAMETLAGDRLAGQVEALAHHAVRGAVWNKAVMYQRQAGVKALERSASREATAFFEQTLAALEHLPRDRTTLEQAIDVRLDLRRALVPLADRVRILDYMHEAEALATELGDQRRLSWITYGIAHCHYLANDQARTVEAGQRALALGGGTDLAHEIGVNLLLGHSFYISGDYRQGTVVLRHNIDLIGDRIRERFGLPIFPTFPAVTSRERLARCLGELGEFSEALQVGENGLRIAEVINHAPSLTGVCLGLGLVHMRHGDLDRARAVLERGLDVGRRGSIYLYVLTVAAAVGRVYALTGRIAEGLALIADSIQEAEAMNNFLGHPFRLAWLAEAYLAAGEYDHAWQQAEKAITLSRHYKEKGQEAWTLHLLGEIATRRDPTDVEDAEGLYRQALALAEPRGMRPLIAHCHAGLGVLNRRTDKAADEHFATATTLYREMGMTYWLERAEREMKGLA
jgi:class 3 adenylate cyclase/tetratricopeptide (TPR) repeat protein